MTYIFKLVHLFCLIKVIRFFILILIYVCVNSGCAQNLKEDTSFHFVGHWHKGEVKKYEIILELYTVTGMDTTNKDIMVCELDVTIKDSTKESYIIEWAYKNYNSETNPWLQNKLNSISNETKTIIRTDKFGKFIEIVNWRETLESKKKVTEEYINQFKNSDVNIEALEAARSITASRENLESIGILDIRQFYMLYGNTFKFLQKSKSKSSFRDPISNNLLESTTTQSYDFVEKSEGYSFFTIKQEVDTAQFTNLSYQIIKKQDIALGKKPPIREEMQTLYNIYTTMYAIDSVTGWLRYSEQTKYNTTPKSKFYEIRTILERK